MSKNSRPDDRPVRAYRASLSGGRTEECGEWPEDRLITSLDRYLERDYDWALFDLLPLSDSGAVRIP